MRSKHTLRVAASLGATLLLTACGGGGGSAGPAYEGPTSGVVITTDNAQALASDAAMLALGPVGSLFDPGYSPDDFYARDHGSRTFPKGIETFLKDTFEAERNRLASMGLRASESEPIECDAGTGRVTLNYSSSAGLTAGDSLVVSFNNCEFMYGSDSEVLNGSLSMTFAELTSTSTSIAFAANNFRIDEKYLGALTGDYDLMHGGYTLTTTNNAPVTSLRLVSTSMLIEQKYNGKKHQTLLTGVDHYYSYDASAPTYTYRVNYTVASTSYGGVVSLKTTADFVATTFGQPTQGRMIITGANGATVQLTAEPGPQLLIEYDLDGNGIYGDNDDPPQDILS